MCKIRYIILVFFLCPISFFGQSENPKDLAKKLRASIFLGIWDKENSYHFFEVDTISYDEIPKELDFRGTIVEALKWEDYLGENILIQTVTGWFPWKDYDDIDSTSYMMQDKWEIYAYLFQKKKEERAFRKLWRVYDYNKCFGVDWYAGFIPKATTITDIDNNGTAEVTMPYVLACRGGMDPATMKIIMYEGEIKYAIRGETKICLKGLTSYGGEYTLGDELKNRDDFRLFLIKRWKIHECENDRFY